jgi:tetratricopeptide (TPR) repeat protein
VRPGRLWIPLGLAASIASASWSFSWLENARASRPPNTPILYLPSGKYMKITSLGCPEVMADLIYIWSIQYYSNYERADRFKYLEHIYGGVISELDPRYVDPYLVGAMIMTVEAGENEMALRLLDKGIAANPGEWILPFDAGFLCYDTLHDYPRAAAYFEKAMNLPGTPTVVRRLHAEMYNKMGDKRTSLEFWKEVAAGAESSYVRDVSRMHVHDLSIEVDLETLRGAVAAWRAQRGGNPPSLEALVEAGLLTRVPLDPEALPYLYDARTGEVRSQSRPSLRGKAAS